MPFRLRVFHKGLILVGLPLLLGLILIASLSYLLYQSDKEKAKEVLYRRGAVLMAKLVALTAEVPLLLAASMEYHSDRLFRAYEKNVELIKIYTKEANEIRAQCPEIKVDFKDALQEGQTKLLAITADFAEKRKKNDFGRVVSNLVQLSKQMTDEATSMSDKLNDMRKHGEDETAATRKKQEQIRNKQGLILLAGLIGNLALGIFLAAFYRRSILQRISRINTNTLALSRGEDMLPELSQGDEIALVDHSFHQMQEQLLEASQRERKLFENASDVICVLDENAVFSRVNPSSLQNWEYAPEDLIGSGVSKLLNSEQVSFMQERIAEAKTKEEPVLFEAKIQSRSGTEKDMLWSLYWSASEQSLFCIAHDISEQKNVERAKAQFVQLMSSNLMLPLNSIFENLNNAIDPSASGLEEQAIAKLEMTSSNSKRLLELVNDLVKMNELQSGKLEIRKETCSVAETLRRSIQDLEAMAQQKNVEIKMQAPEGDWFVDTNRLIQVLVNLLSNAIKFSPAGTCVLLKAEISAGFVICRVVDQGRGVPEDKKLSIFEKFAQAEASDSKRQSGTGLGLPICKQIIEELDGEIGVESEEGQGSCFWFKVPVDQTSAELVRESKLKARESNQLSLAETQITKPEKTPSSVVMPALLDSRNFSLGSKGLLLVCIPLFCEFVIAFSLFLVLGQVDRERAKELHERLVSNFANSLVIASIDSQVRMSHEYSDAEWQRIQTSRAISREKRAGLYQLIKNDPSELEWFNKSADCFKSMDDCFEQAKENVKQGRPIFMPFAERHALVPTLLKLFHNMKKIIEIAETKEGTSPEKQKKLRELQANVLIIGLAANILSSILLAIYFSKDINSRLMLLADNANKLADDKALNPLLSGTDEIARIDSFFHETAQALAEARKKERAIFDNSKDVICIIDKSGRFLSINPACKSNWGYSKDAVLKEKDLLSLTLAEDREITKASLLEDTLKQKQISFENRIVTASGAVVYTQWSVSRKEGDPMLYCIAHDISARKELERIKQEFLAMVSHDLRSPLTAIHGIAQLTIGGKYGPVPERELKLLGQINQDCRELVELISDLLDLEKLEAGKMQLQIEEIELADVLNKAISSCLQKDKVKLDYTPELDETVLHADLDRLSQAFCNIINFAVADSSQKVRLRLSRIENWGEVTITDNAPPLSEKDRSELFARQNNAGLPITVSDKIERRLSLALARSIIEKHGGEVSVDTHEEGNRFTVRVAIDDLD